ncbi:MarR family winged helix-turn-helix transcriptional regulator [Conexibacter sp. CPCC 206217]|uniref:MarR family winged helix-turn-helix transcriptional regulator n=1 Tax=Conexibacter sp. CPCC 206217 TaxID=3064574 RepID=UPI00272807E4|nr:MarR family transcriptional regulator [Conexibacter sp. CPCC 206217]MDO8213060.1 MarR family transcriptional regulator [Conexibacter sp. CPCC 206217]
MTEPLTPDELRLWHAWKNAGERVRARVVHDVAAATDLSEPDFGVLDRLVKLGGGGRLAQQQLADSMRWSKSRLSRHLTRMQARDLVTRRARRDGPGTAVAITPAGRRALDAALPVHADAVRRHLTDRITPDEAQLVLALAERLQRERD